ncbi:MAG: hypothetical protein CMJ83_07080 [Planctomycetes bacterium]|nr:hypothetical protein [Planctomycetota bacterium]
MTNAHRTALLVPVAILLVSLSAAPAQESGTGLRPKAEAGAAAHESVVRIAVSVDWEGRNLSSVNLRAFVSMRKAHPKVPLTHFLNAAYYTKADAETEDVTKAIRRVVHLHDELGLHIHPWRSLVEAAGVTFRAEPTIWGPRFQPRRRGADTGHAVVIEAYEVAELRAIVRTSKKLLGQHGFKLGTSFRAGAWLAGPRVREAIRREGFVVDSSATNTIWHEELAKYALPEMIAKTWPKVTAESQPFWLKTPGGELLEMPDTCALADYVTAKEMAGHVTAAVQRLEKNGPDLYVHIGFHQETAARYATRVTQAIKTIQATHGSRVVFETLQASAKRARTTIKAPR